MSEIKIKTNVKKSEYVRRRPKGGFSSAALFRRAQGCEARGGRGRGALPRSGGWDEANGERRKNVSKRE